jgi:formate dehydrogenase subunit beta
MSTFSKIDVKDRELLTSLHKFFRGLLELKKIDALMVPCHSPVKNLVMPTLVFDPENLDRSDPLAPSFPINAAKVASKLTKRKQGETIAIVMRSCEIRAFVELIKLRQGSFDNVVIIGIDCLGALSNKAYVEFAGEDKMGSTQRFYKSVLGGTGDKIENFNITPACKICEHPIPVNADIIIGLYGIDYENKMMVEAATPAGKEIVKDLNLKITEEPAGRKKAIESLISDRIVKRDGVFEDISEITPSIEKLSGYLSSCVNCYNCRVACPVCYCKECVFVTDVFDHDPYQYLQWAKRKGSIRMPTDTDFFHLTRMAHISLSCVGCGQCSNACPNEIPVMELFRTISHYAQESFDYEAGRSVDEPIPLSVFNDEEYGDVVGISLK